MEQLWEDTAKANGRKYGKTEVPKRHGGTPVPGGAAREVLLAQDDEEPVQDNGDYGDPGILHHPIAKDHRVSVQLPAVQNSS